MQIEEIMNPFGGMPNMGFPAMGIPTIIIGRKNLKKNRGSPIISPLNMFNELDLIFESFFDSIADSMINENSAIRINGKSTNKSEEEDDHIELDQLDLRLNETDSHSVNTQKPIEQPQKVDKETKENNDINGNELKVEDVERNEHNLNAGKIEE